MTDHPATAQPRRLSKPSPPHNHLYDGAPAMCMCVACCRYVLSRRCPVETRAGRCGEFRGHSGSHTLLVETIFMTAEERVRLDD